MTFLLRNGPFYLYGAWNREFSGVCQGEFLRFFVEGFLVEVDSDLFFFWGASSAFLRYIP